MPSWSVQRLRVLVAVAVAIAVLSAATPSARAQFCGATAIPAGNLYNGFGVALAANGVYAVVGAVTVPSGQTLLVPSGVVFKMQAGAVFNINGVLVVNGTSGAPVYWTSLKDDAVGGDTNCNLGADAPAPGDWVGLKFAGGASASNLQHCRVRYAGGVVGGIPSAAVTLTGCHLAAHDLQVSASLAAGLDLTASSSPTVSGSSFDGGTYAVRNARLTSVPGFTNCTASGNSVYDQMHVSSGYLTASVAISTVNTLNANGVLVLSDNLDVNATLTLNAGVVVKLSGNRAVNVNQVLLSNGTPASPVTITSLKDDAVGGDTNKNGAADAPLPGDWSRVFFNNASDASVVVGLHVRYAGAGGAAAVLCGGSSCTLDGVVTDFTAGPGLSLQNNSFPSVINCAFNHGTFAVRDVLMDAIPGFVGCTAFGNSVYDQMYLNSANVTTPIAVGVANTLNGAGVIIYATNFDVNAPLTLGPGVTFKCEGSYTITVNFALVTNGSAQAPVTFTTLKDDAVGGDTNKNGTTDVAAPGDWAYMHFTPTSDASVCTGMHVRFAGASVLGSGPNPAVFCNGSNCVFDGLVTHASLSAGLSLQNNSFATVTNSAFNGGTVAVRDVQLSALAGFSGCSASSNSVYDDVLVTSANVLAPTALGPANTLNGGGTIVLATNLDVGATLTLNAGLVLKFSGARTANVNQTLIVNGTALAPVVFTSVKDDAFGGDTNRDGGATVPAKGDWTYASFNGSSDASVIRFLRVRYAGSGGNPVVRCIASDATFEDCVFEHGNAYVIDLQNGSFPTATRCGFNSGTVAVAAVRPGALQKFRRCTATGNSVYDAHWMNNAAVAAGESWSWSAINTLNGAGVVVLAASPNVAAGGSLTVGSGMILKFAINGTLTCSGGATLNLRGTGHDPVVVTSIHDDAFGGDTNKNLGATIAAPGQWTYVNFASGGAPSTVEYVRVRFGGASTGSGPNPSVLARSANATWRALRVDRSLGSGAEFTAAAGVCDHLVAWANGLDGLVCSNVATTFRHPTSAGNLRYGVRRTGAAVATFINGVVFGNASAAFNGVPAGDVSFTCGLTGGGPGNFLGDPLFTDAANGDLTLQLASPCVETGDVPTASASMKDHVEASRLVDGRLLGTPLADMGAYEASPYRLAVAGHAWSGSVVQMTVLGPPGLAAFALGGLTGVQSIPPWGFSLADPLAALQVFAFAPVGANVIVPVPDVSALQGVPFGLQALAVPAADPSTGAFTNLYRGVIDG
jgi:hypothetical protein